MGIGVSIFLIAVGAVLRFAVTVSTHGFNIHTVGVILLIVGIVGLLVSLFMMAVWSRRTDPTVVDDPRYRAPRQVP
jgi:beta-lactamase regulating signal transducer with metallopeptidase domain